MGNFFATVQLLKASKAFWKPPKSVWSWLYSNGDSNELSRWTFIHTSWTLQYVSERNFFPKLLEGLICGSFISKWWEEFFAKILKGLFLVLIFSYNLLMTLLMMLSVTLLSMLMMLLSALSAIRYQICGNNKRWLLNLNLNCETLKVDVGRGLLILILKRLAWFVWLVL